MYLSFNWLKEFIDINCSPLELKNILTMLGIEVESIIDYKEKYKNFYIGQVLKKDIHPNADKLSVCQVMLGKDDVYQVICGAPNVDVNQKVVFAKIGAIIPDSKLEIKKVTIRQIESQGMICSQKELEISDNHQGIWVLPDETPIGIPFSEFFNNNDVVFEIGITPNRADCLSHIGIARVLSAYFDKPIKLPEIKIQESEIEINNIASVEIQNPEYCPRYIARVIKDVEIKESPYWLQAKLINLGLRPINSVVDITNYVLLECGHPLHAFDLNKLAGSKIIVRTANNDKEFVTLDSKKRDLEPDMLMICDAEKPVAIAGIMGGENSEITESTKDILIESAYFNPTSIRKTAKRLGITSEASYRFERGTDVENTLYAVNRVTQLIQEISGGKVCKGIIDIYPQKIQQPQIIIRKNQAEKIIGINLEINQIKDFLNRLNCKIISENDNELIVVPPTYRVDLNSEIDLIEEIAILYGYDNIEPNYSTQINLKAEKLPPYLSINQLKEKIRNFFIYKGFNEILTQNQIDPKSAQLISDTNIEIKNPLGEELSIMKPSTILSTLKIVQNNLRLGNNNLQIFEIGKSFHTIKNSFDTPIPNVFEREELTIALTGNTSPKQWGKTSQNYDFYDLKGIIQELFEFFKFKDISFKNSIQNKVFTNISLDIFLKDQYLGTFGQISKKILDHFEIEKPVFLANIYLSELYNIKLQEPTFNPIPPYPAVLRDLAFVVDNKIPSEKIYICILESAGELLKNLVIFDIYEGKQIGEGKKSVAFNLSFNSNERTLTDDEVDQIIDKIVKNIENKFNAILRKF